MTALEQLVIDWMSRKGPAEWHGLAVNWNWDEGEEPLAWIVDQPGCDRATALTIFWNGEGYSQLEERLRPYAPDSLMPRIVERILANWPYSTERFSFRLPQYARDLSLPTYGLAPDTLARLKPLMISIAGEERYPIYGGVPAECRIAYLELLGEPVSDFDRRLLVEEQAGKNMSQTDAEVAKHHQQELEESLSDLEDMIAEVERIRRQKG